MNARVVTIGLAILVVGMVPAVASAQAATAVVCGAFSLNVRLGPGVEHAAVDALNGGTSVSLTGETNGIWYKITSPIAGWSSGKYLCGTDGKPLVATATSAAPAAAPAGSNYGPTMTWAEFQTLSQGVTDPYELIRRLDLRPEKVDHPKGGYTLTTGVDEAYILWTGLYVDDPTIGGAVAPFLVDGKTGTWVVLPNKTVVIPTPGGTIKVTAYTGGTAQTSGACVDKTSVVAIINQNKATPNQIYVKLDELVDANPAARLRGDGPTTIQGVNTQTLIWVRTGKVEGDNVLPLDSVESKTLYIVTKTGPVTINYAFSGVSVCQPINPANDFPWWGK